MNVIQKIAHTLAKETAQEKNRTLKDVLEAVTSQFEFVKGELEKGERGNPDTYKTILLKYLGTFAFSNNKHSAIRRNLKKNIDDGK